MAIIAFADSETRSLFDVTVTGAYKYSMHPSTEGIVWGYVFDEEPNGKVWSPNWCWGNTTASKADPFEPTDLLDHVENGGYVAFWNAFFDRNIWNNVMVPKYDWPYLELDQVLCAQAQAEANNLPGSMGKACEALGTHHVKDSAGTQLIKQLSDGDRETWNSARFETTEKMGRFRAYCMRDVIAMRDVWYHVRPLTLDEWAEYHASERVNDRGVMIDTAFAKAAVKYATAESDDLNAELLELTGDKKLTITNHLRKAVWLHDHLQPYDEELAELTRRPPKTSGPKKDKPRFSADRATREAVLELLSQPAHADLFPGEKLDTIIEVLECIEAGNSAAVRKFTSMTNQVYDDRVRGSYSFCGAGQTGRFSSRGVQMHNMVRLPLDKKNPDRAIDAIEDILDGTDAETLREKYDLPVSRLLARLTRPTFIAPEGKILVWGDWDQIEGRCLPWLAYSPGAEAKLDLYRKGIDVYSVTASDISGIPIKDIDSDTRQAQGKVPELALGFGGSVGALSAMGRSYGVVLPEKEKVRIVRAWRAKNSWCVAFWHELWEAAMNAYKQPGTWWHAGRVKYLFHPNLMRGTLVCALPDGRWLVYPQFKHEYVEYEDDGGVMQSKMQTTFVRGFGSGSARVELWYGTLAENITQGTAASFLRRAVRKLCDILVLHTHDEVVAEVDEDKLNETLKRIVREMEYLPAWAEGLPLSVTMDSGPFYTK